jgi:filamentous hemagglutinin
MNNGFPGSFTPMGNNMGLSCQPNVNSSQPGHCVLHHVKAEPVSNFRVYVASARNSTMDPLIGGTQRAQNQQGFARHVEQQRNLYMEQERKRAAEKRANNPAAVPKSAVKDSVVAPKPAAKTVPKPAATSAPKSAAKAAPKPAATTAPKSAAKAAPKPAATTAPKSAAKAAPKPAVTTAPKSAAKAAPKPAATVNRTEQFIQQLKQYGIQAPDSFVKFNTQQDCQVCAPKAAAISSAPKPVSMSPNVIAALAQRDHVFGGELVRERRAQRAKERRLEAEKIQQWNNLETERIQILDDLEADLAKIESMRAAPPFETNIPANNSHETSRHPVEFTIGYDFLNQSQRAKKDKELAECQTEIYKIGTEAKWGAADFILGVSFGAGMIEGIPAGIFDAVDEIVNMASSPAETFQALKSLYNSDNALDKVSEAFKQSWNDSIDRMEAEYQKGGISGSFNAGVEGGKLASDALAMLTVAGVAKTGAVAVGRVVTKAASKAELTVKAGAEMVLPGAQKVRVQGNTSEYMAGYNAPKVVTHTSEAEKLASLDKLRSAQFAANPALENNSLGKALTEAWTIAVPHPAKVAEQLLEIGVKASITGLTTVAIKDIADRITPDELEHITTLGMTGNPAVTGHYLSSLQDKYAPVHTGNPQLADTALRNTGSNPSLAPQASGHTGNNQISGQGVTHTGNTAGVTDSGIKAIITPIPHEPSVDDLAYLAGDNQYVPSPKHAPGGWGTPMDLSDTKAQEVLNNSMQGGKQRYGITDGKLYEFQPDNVGGWHGYPIPGTEAPPKILREFLSRGDISKAEYNKMIKGK